MQRKAANNSKDASFTLQLAAHYARMKNPAAMTATLQRRLESPTDFPKARLEVGDPDQARKYYEEDIRNSPADKSDYQKRLVQLLIAQGKRGEALNLLDGIVKDKPDDMAARTSRATLLLASPSNADRQTAVRELQDAVEKNPNDATLRQEFGRALVAAGKADEARKQFEVIRRRSDALPPRFSLAELALRRRDYEGALRYSSEILALSPNERRARLIRSIGLMESGKLTEANAELHRLLKDTPDYADAKLQLGQAIR